MQTYYRYREGQTPAGALIIRFYHSGEQIRGYIREVAERDQTDTIFPGEEMQPDDAFRTADNKNRDPKEPIYVELSEGVQWDPAWGKLTY